MPTNKTFTPDPIIATDTHNQVAADLAAQFAQIDADLISFGVIIDANEAKADGRAREFADDTSVAPAVPGEPTEAEITVFTTAGSIVDALVRYTGTDVEADPATALFLVDANGAVTALGTGSGAALDRVHVTDTALAPALPQAPTDTEVQAYVTTNTITGVLLYYTGTDIDADNPTYVYDVDGSGAVTRLNEPSEIPVESFRTLDGVDSLAFAVAAAAYQTIVHSAAGEIREITVSTSQDTAGNVARVDVYDGVGLGGTLLGSSLDFTASAPAGGGFVSANDVASFAAPISVAAGQTISVTVTFVSGPNDLYWLLTDGATLAPPMEASMNPIYDFQLSLDVFGVAAGNDLAHLTNTAVAPAVTGLPSLAEIQAAVTTASLVDVTAYYNGSDTPDPALAEGVYAVDGSGVAIEVNNSPLTDLTVKASQWSTSNVDTPIQVQAGLNNSFSTRLADNSGTDAGFYTGPGAAPVTGTQYVRVRVADVGTPGHGFAVQTADFAAANLATAVMNPFDGSTTVTQLGTGVAPSVVSTLTRDGYFEWVLAFTGVAGALTWRLYPAYSDAAALGTEDVSRVDSIDLLDIDWDYPYVPASAAVATVIDSSAGAVAEVLPAATGAGAIVFFANEDVTNTASLAPAAGEQLNGSVDGLFHFSNYAAGTQFRADDIAAGQWVVSVVGATSTTDPVQTAPLTELTSTSHTLITGTTPTTGQLAINSIRYIDEGSSFRRVYLDFYSFQDDQTVLQLGAAVVPATAAIRSAYAAHGNGSSAPNASDHRPSIYITGVNEITVNRDNADQSGVSPIGIVLLVEDSASTFSGGQTVLAGMVTPTSLAYAYLNESETTEEGNMGSVAVVASSDATALLPTGQKLDLSTPAVSNSSDVAIGADSLTVAVDGRYEIDVNLGIINNTVGARSLVQIARNDVELLAVGFNEGDATADRNHPVPVSWSGDLVAGDSIAILIGTSAASNIFPSYYNISVKQLPTSTVVMPDAGQQTVIPSTDLVTNDQAASGYFDIGTMRMQWGVVPGTASLGDIVFPAAFADTGYSFVANVEAATTSDLFVVQHSVKTTTQVHYDKVFHGPGIDDAPSGAITEPFSWQAIGMKP